jgi:diguanylate cyclase (GGDEF)-like protein
MRQTGDQNAVSQTDTRADLFPSEEAERQLEFFAEVSQHDAQAKKSKIHVVRARHAAPLDLHVRQRARVKRLMLAGVLALIYLFVIGIFYLQGLIGLRVLQVSVVLAGGFFLLFRLSFALGLNLKIQEKNLRLPMTVSAIGVVLYTVYIAPVTQIAFVPFLFLLMAFVMHRLSPREMLFLAGATLVGYALVVAVHYATLTDSAMLTLECAQLLVLAVTLPGFAVLANRVQRLHSALFKANRKIRNIEEDAQRDVLLGCFNRRYIVAALEQQKRLADETGSPLCLAVIDLDHFKRINDEAGHLGGDEVLRIFTRIAQANIRAGDVFGRYGGEEFLLVLPETSLLAALNVAERIREQVEHFDWDEKLRNRVTVSIGLTQHLPGESVLDLFSRTDTAMYMAKQGGRNQVVVEEPTLDIA